MELALLCEVKVLMCVVDKNEKTSIYCSENNLEAFLQYYILNSQIPKEIFWSKDYKELFIDNLKISEFNESKGNNRMWMMADNASVCSESEEKLIQSNKNIKKSTFFHPKQDIPLELLNHSNMGQQFLFNGENNSNFQIIEDDKDGISFDNISNFHNKSMMNSLLLNPKNMSMNNTYYSADSSHKGLPEKNDTISNNVTNATNKVNNSSVNSSMLDHLELDSGVQPSRMNSSNMLRDSMNLNSSLPNMYQNNYLSQLYHQNLLQQQKQLIGMKRQGLFPSGYNTGDPNMYLPNSKSQFEHSFGNTLNSLNIPMPNQGMYPDFGNTSVPSIHNNFNNVPFNYTNYYLGTHINATPTSHFTKQEPIEQIKDPFPKKD